MLTKRNAYILAGSATLLLIALTVFVFIPRAQLNNYLETNPGARTDRSGTIYLEVTPADLILPQKATKIIFYFAQPMDHASVEQSIRISDQVRYLTSWNGESFIIQLTAGFLEINQLTVTFTQPIRSIEGQEYPPTSWTFTLVDPLALGNPQARSDTSGQYYVSYILPSEPEIPRRATMVTIGFTSPMDQASVEQALQLTEGLTYFDHWEGNNLMIRISNGYQNLDQFTVHLVSPILSAEGEEFPPTSWTFSFLQPTATPTHRPTRTPSPTPTGSPTPTQWAGLETQMPVSEGEYITFFPVPDDQPLGIPPDNAPTPIPIPSLEVGDYRLVDWSPDHALAMVQLIDQYAYASDIIGAGYSRWNYRVAQEWVLPAVEEAISRYPNSPYIDAFEWKLARTNFFLSLDEASDWLVTAIEDKLNSGNFPVEDLSQMLEASGIFVNIEEVPNIFGGGQDGWLISVSPGFDGDVSLIALRETSQGVYDMVPVVNQIAWVYPDSLIDRTGNQIPEISVVSANGCILMVFEWQGDGFDDLGRGQIESGDREYCMFDFSPIDSADYTIETIQPLGPRRTFTWNGEYFEVTSEIYRDDYALLEVQDRLRNQEYEQTVEKIKFVLENWPIEDYGGEGVPQGSYTDLLRFDLGISLAYLEKINEAMTIFRELASTPTDLEYPAVSQAAEAFLEHYRGDSSTIFSGCQAANQIINTALDHTAEEEMAESFSQVYGFNPWIGFALTIQETCGTFPSIEYLASSVPAGDISRFPEILEQGGAQINDKIWADLDGDDAEDWILSLAPDDLILVTTNQGKIIILELKSNPWGQADPEIELSLELLTPPGSTQPVVLISDLDTFGIFHLEKTGAQTGIVWHENTTIGGIDQISILNKPVDSEIQVYSVWDLSPYEDADYAIGFRVYRWDIGEQRYHLVDLPLEVLFTDQDPTRAIQVILEILNRIKEYQNEYPEAILEFNEATSISFSTLSEAYRPRLLYLLGLAYELNGNLNEARQTYYDLWYDYPESPYAIMARAKLEPVSP